MTTCQFCGRRDGPVVALLLRSHRLLWSERRKCLALFKAGLLSKTELDAERKLRVAAEARAHELKQQLCSVLDAKLDEGDVYGAWLTGEGA